MNVSKLLGISGLLLLAACSGRLENEPRSTDPTAPPTSPSSPPGSTDSTSISRPHVALDGATELRFSRDSMGGARPKGDACQELHVSVGVVRATRTATWSSCRGVAGSRALVEGTRVLTEEEESRFEADVQAAVYKDFDGKDCGYDGTLYGLNVVASTGAQLYVHENINCYKDGRRIAPDVANLTRELWELATGEPLP